jgi:recombination protein RecR
MKFSPLIDELIKCLKVLPGVGGKSAQRMAFSLLEKDRKGALNLSQALFNAMEHVHHCAQCRTFTEETLCDICANPKRQENGQLCIVESPQDVIAIEQTSQFSGCYFVLGGRLSPIDGIGPQEIGIVQLTKILKNQNIKEVILATNPTVEGEATAHYIAQLCQELDVKASRIAHGVPIGGELEYVDGSTISHALHGRQTL